VLMPWSIPGPASGAGSPTVGPGRRGRVSPVPHRAENVGSLLRPRYLLDARAGLERGELSPARFKRPEDRAVDEAIALQEACAASTCSRTARHGARLHRQPARQHRRHRRPAAAADHLARRTALRHRGSDPGPSRGTRSADRLRRLRSVATEEFAYLRARTDRPTKATLPRPPLLAKWWNPSTSPQACPDPFDACAAAAEFLADEIRVLVRLGCAYVQIDATDIATLADPAVRDQYDRLGIGADRMLGEGVDLLNSLAAAGGATAAIHLCKGNSEGRFIAAGACDEIAGRVFRGSAATASCCSNTTTSAPAASRRSRRRGGR